MAGVGTGVLSCICIVGCSCLTVLQTERRCRWVAITLLGMFWVAFLWRPADAKESATKRFEFSSLRRTASSSAELVVAAPVPIELTLVHAATQIGAVCLDGSPPGYHLDRGSGPGSNSWIIHLQGGAWCADDVSCAERSQTSLGSSHYMNSSIFQGILSSSPVENPYFYNWNRVKVRYCDGGSFSGNVDLPTQARIPGTNRYPLLFYRGQRIWLAVIADLLSKGMTQAVQAILSGESAGGLASFIHCNAFKELLPAHTDVRCISDGGFFLDIPDIDGIFSMRSYFGQVVTVQNISNSLPKRCIAERGPEQCFFPQYFLEDITVPMFVIESAYDTYQIRDGLVPSSEDPNGVWTLCKENPTRCSADELNILQGFRNSMLGALHLMETFDSWGLFLISCFYHTQSQGDYLWNGPSRVGSMSLVKATGDWITNIANGKYIDCAYPCNPTCIGVL